jgi:hypothetical protein
VKVDTLQSVYSIHWISPTSSLYDIDTSIELIFIMPLKLGIRQRSKQDEVRRGVKNSPRLGLWSGGCVNSDPPLKRSKLTIWNCSDPTADLKRTISMETLFWVRWKISWRAVLFYLRGSYVNFSWWENKRKWVTTDYPSILIKLRSRQW